MSIFSQVISPLTVEEYQAYKSKLGENQKITKKFKHYKFYKLKFKTVWRNVFYRKVRKGNKVSLQNFFNLRPMLSALSF